MHLSTIPGRRTAALLLCAGSLTLAACGSSDDDADAGAGAGSSSGNAATSSSDASDRDTARLRLQECLREQGIDLPDNLGGPGGGAPPADLDRDAIQEALQGPCEDLAQGAFGDISDQDQQEFQDQLQEFRQCMEEQGVEVPDFRPGQGGGAPPAGDFDPDDPDFQAASEKCQDSAPTRGPLGGGGQDGR